MPQIPATDQSAEKRPQMMLTLPTDQGAYLPDIAFAAEDGSVSAARLHGIKYGRKEALSGNPVKKSEDSFAGFSHLAEAASLGSDAAKEKLESILAAVRRETITEPGGATLTGVIAGKDGISFANIGDSHIFIVGDGGEEGRVVKLNLPHQHYVEEYGREFLGGSVGGGRRALPPGHPFADEIDFISYDAIRSKVGENARVILASDGLLEQFRHKSKEENVRKYQQEMKALDTKAMNELVGSVLGNDARLLASKALADGSGDDIAVISLAASPGHAGFLSDGVGGGEENPVFNSGAITSRKTIAVASREMLRGVSVTPESLSAGAFDPARTLAEPIYTHFEHKEENGEFRIIGKDGHAFLAVRGDNLEPMERELARRGIQVEQGIHPETGAPEMRIDIGYGDLLALLPPKMHAAVAEIHRYTMENADTADLKTNVDKNDRLNYAWSKMDAFAGEKEIVLPRRENQEGKPWAGSRVQHDDPLQPPDTQRGL